MVGGGPSTWSRASGPTTRRWRCPRREPSKSDGFNPFDQLVRCLRWKRKGHHSSTGKCFDIGGTVASALTRCDAMACPGPAALTNTPRATDRSCAWRRFRCSSPAIRKPPRGRRGELADDPCRARSDRRVPLMAGLIIGAFRGRPRNQFLAPLSHPFSTSGIAAPLAPKIRGIAAGSFLPRASRRRFAVPVPVVASLRRLSRRREKPLLRARCALVVDLGDDADTTGAVYGQIMGILWRWRRTGAMAHPLVTCRGSRASPTACWTNRKSHGSEAVMTSPPDGGDRARACRA